MKHLMLLFVALFAFVAPAGEIQDRFLYVACGLSGDRQIDETIALVRRAARQEPRDFAAKRWESSTSTSLFFCDKYTG